MNGIGVAFTPYRPTQLGATAATVGGGDDGEAALHERRLDGGASGEENIPSLRRIQRTILGFLHGPQEAYDARVVCETGGIVVQRLLHGLRHLVAQNPEYDGQNFRTCRKVTASSHPNHSFRFMPRLLCCTVCRPTCVMASPAPAHSICSLHHIPTDQSCLKPRRLWSRRGVATIMDQPGASCARAPAIQRTGGSSCREFSGTSFRTISFRR